MPTPNFTKPKKVFMFSSENLAEFINGNFIDGAEILDETEDSYLVRSKNGTRPVDKMHIAEWLAGSRGVDKEIERYGKKESNNFVSERESNLAVMRKDDQLLHEFYAQLPENRLEFNMKEASKKEGKKNTLPPENIYKGADYYRQLASEEA